MKIRIALVTSEDRCNPLLGHARSAVAIICLQLWAVDAAAQSVSPINTYNRQAVVDLYNNVYLQALAVPNDWTGSVSGCSAGTVSAAYANATIAMVNYFRAMTRLPSAVTHDPVQDVKNQQAALMMRANNAGNHNPPPSWLCYTADGAQAAAGSNLSAFPGASGVVDFVDDWLVPSLGHRRRVLFPLQTTMGTGSTDFQSTLWVMGPYGSRPPGPAWVAWPSAGFVPYQVLTAEVLQSRRPPGAMIPTWSFSINSDQPANYSSATVRMTNNGVSVPQTVAHQSGPGDGIVSWQPAIAVGPGMTDKTFLVEIDNVVVGGTSRKFSYTVTVIDPAALPSGSPPGAPSNVLALAGDRQLTVSFAAPASPGSGAVTAYIATAQPGGATATGITSPLTIHGLTNGTPYTVTVAAVNSAGTGPAGAAAGPVVPLGTTGVVGAPTNLSVTSVAGNLVTFAWLQGPGTLPVTGYFIEGGMTPGSVLGGIAVGNSASPVTLALPTGAYYVRLYALSGTARSAASNEIRLSVNLPAPPSAPTNLLGLVNGDVIGLAWVNTQTGGSQTGLLLDVSGSLSATVALPATDSFSVAGVPSGTYTIRVRATNAAGSSPPSNPVTLSFPGPCSGSPLTPVDFGVIRSGRTLAVAWKPALSGPAPASYALAVSGAFVGNLSTTSRTLSGSVAPGTYTFTIAAANVCGSSPASVSQTVVVP